MKEKQYPVSSCIVTVLLDNQIIQKNQRAVYLYCINGILEYTAFAVAVLVLSILLGRIFSGLLILFMFALIKSYTGGIHAPDATSCFCCSIFSVLIILFLSTQDYILHICSTPLIALPALLLLFVLSPVASPNKLLGGTKKKLFRKKAAINCTVFLAIDAILYYLRYSRLSCVMNLTFLLISLTVLWGYIIYQTRDIL